MPSFYEFFAGGGMARAGLGKGWDCLFANDFCEKKARAYADNWGQGDIVIEDVGLLTCSDLPGHADLVWASFPCQDLSLAGKYLGIGERTRRGETRSGSFWPFWGLMEQLQFDQRAPKIIVLENVVGAITSNSGRDFAVLCETLMAAGYFVGPLVLDAEKFVPQSRPRLFIVAVRSDQKLPGGISTNTPDSSCHPANVIDAKGNISNDLAVMWKWWSLPSPAKRTISLLDLIEDSPTGCDWHSVEETDKLLGLMAPLHRQKLSKVVASSARAVGGVYKRTRVDGFGIKRQRAEIRFDGIAGCLRTPGGGSSRQIVVLVEEGNIRSRLLSPREAARLMGLPEGYRLPAKYNEAYHLIGDGVCVPVVSYLAKHLLRPILNEGVDQGMSVAA